MKTKMIISLILMFTFSAFAGVSFKEATQHLVEKGLATDVRETWIKYTCFGPLTPVGVYPIIEGEVMSFHYPVPVGESYPSIKEVQDEDFERFEKFARICTVRRFAMTDLSGWSGDWLDWGSAYYDSKIRKDAVVIRDNQCRELGSPCHDVSQCCSMESRSSGTSRTAQTLACNPVTNTCEFGGRQE